MTVGSLSAGVAFLLSFDCSRILRQCGLCALAFAGLHAFAEPVSVGTKLEIRLQQPISSYATEKGTRISGVLVAPLTESGEMLLPLGTTVEGSVVAVRKVGLGVVHETARLELRFDRVVLADGTSVPLQCKVMEVENARESVDAQGRIQGIRSTATLSNRASVSSAALPLAIRSRPSSPLLRRHRFFFFQSLRFRFPQARN